MQPRMFSIRSTPLRMLLALSLSIAVLSACKKSEEAPKTAPAPPAAAPQAQSSVRITGVDLGNAVGADKRVTAPSVAFKPNDTIYASVATEGAAPNASLAARWSYQGGQVVNESSQNITPTGPTVTEFHIAKPDGWPTGTYQLEISLNGKPTAARQFTVTD